MKVVALVSGGKDSCYNMMQCVSEGHEIVALANLRPKDKDELDSYMFQTVGHHAIDLYAEAMGLPLYRRTLEGQSVEQGKDYTLNMLDEVEDLFMLLKEIKEKEDIEGVSVGAILSDYQRVRVEHVCLRLGLKPLAFLWRRDQEELMQEMLACGVKAIIIKVATLGLTPKHLGKTLAEIQPHMIQMKEKYGLNVCGEGGEYETFTLDCPLFRKTIILDDTELVMHSDDPIAPVAYLNLRKLHLEEKAACSNTKEMLASLPMKRSSQILEELFLNDEVERLNSTSSDEAPGSICEDCRQNRLAGKPGTQIKQNVQGWTWISGLVATDEDGSSVADQTQHVMDKLKETLQNHQLSMSDLVAVHLYVGNMGHFGSVNQVYTTYFSLKPPIRVCVEAALPLNVGIQIDCIAHKEVSSSSAAECVPRHTMHVQGLSHWAPANFAPYSQAVKTDCRIYIAGQIALVPATMEIITGGILPQCRLSLRSVQRILQAMSPDCGLADVTTGVCYITDRQDVDTAEAEWNRALAESGCCNDVEEEDAPQKGNPSRITYVVIPALPKAALVEWQVALSARPSTCHNYQATCGDNGYSSRASVTSFHADCDKLFSLSLQGAVDLSAESPFKPSATTCIKLMLKVISLGLKKASSSLSCLDSLRVFYVAGDFDQEDLISVYRQLAGNEETTDHGPVPVFVPVLGLQTPNQKLTFCH